MPISPSNPPTGSSNNGDGENDKKELKEEGENKDNGNGADEINNNQDYENQMPF